MKKKRLEISYDDDFTLWGIISSARGYKLAWELNQALHIGLQKQDDLIVPVKGGVLRYTVFTHDSGVVRMSLFRNRATDQEREALVPEFQHMDYIFYVKDGTHEAGNRLHELLRDIPSIALSAFIPLAALKTKEVFIF
jgi:hypothetical protein